MDKSSRMKINKEVEELNNTIDQMNITDLYRTSYPTRIQNTHSSQGYMKYSQG